MQYPLYMGGDILGVAPGYPRPHPRMKGLAIMFAIVNRYSKDGVLTISKVYGPFSSREEAEEYNCTQFPSPELNTIVKVFEPLRHGSDR